MNAVQRISPMLTVADMEETLSPLPRRDFVRDRDALPWPPGAVRGIRPRIWRIRH